jgi:hypothetical protein
VGTAVGTGTKHDAGKVRLDLLPYESLEEIGKVLTFGASKYDDHNWRGGMAWSRLLGALLRHIFAWASGQDKDPETGLSHLAHAGCCIVFLLSYEKLGAGEDDRYIVPNRPIRRRKKGVSN